MSTYISSKEEKNSKKGESYTTLLVVSSVYKLMRVIPGYIRKKIGAVKQYLV